MSNENRGRFILCKFCGFKFKFNSSEERDIWTKNKLICPDCSKLYCNKPKTESQLFILQDEYLINRDEKILNEMYKILIVYCKSLFFKIFKNTPINTFEVKYYVENAVSLFIEEFYYAKLHYKVIASFAGILILKLKQALYSKKEIPLGDISLDYQHADNNFVQYEDKNDYFSYIENKCDKYFLINNIYDIIIEISNYSTTPLENYLRELALYIHLKKGEKYSDKFFKLYRKICPEGKIIYMYTLEILKDKLKKEIEN